MSTYSARRCLALVACLAVTAVAIPATASAITKLEKRQNRALVKQKRALANQKKALTAAETAIKSLFGKDTSQDADDTAGNAKDTTQDAGIADVKGSVDTILAAVPEVVTNLTAAGEGLKALKAALETQVSPALTALAANLTLVGTNLQLVATNLTSLGAAYQAVEYGVAKVFASGPATPTIAAGESATSSDIPDDGNTAHVNDQAMVIPSVSDTMTINLRADIRSAESDNHVGDTVGQAGGFVQVQNLTTGAHVDCVGVPAPGIVGTLSKDQATGFGQPTEGDTIVTPAGPVTNLPLRNLSGGVTRTDTTHPDGTSRSLLAITPCNFAATAGTIYGVSYSVNFVDIPTSATPGGTE